LRTLSTLVLALAVTLSGGCVSTTGLPPLWETETGLPGGVTKHRAVFDLWENRVESDGTEHTTVRLLGTKRTGPDPDSYSLHVLPPFFHKSKSAVMKTATFWPLYFGSESGTESQREKGESNDDVWLFPLLAWGEQPGEGSYFTMLPFGGTLKGKLLADEINIYVFPLYLTTVAGDWNSTHVLWPLIAWGSSPTRSHFRVLPFWSASDGERYHRRSLLWPIFHWHTVLRGDREVKGWMVFPLLGRRAATDGSSWQWTFLFPLFQFARDERTGDTYDAILWPIYKRSVRPGVETSIWFWPFWGNTVTEDKELTFYIWPLGWSTWQLKGKIEAKRNYFVPIWMRSTTGPVGEEPTAVATRSWPLFSHETRPDGTTRGRFPEIIPVFGWDAGERVYADLLSLVRWESDADGRTSWDGPLGIFGYRRKANGARSLRILWWLEIPLGGGE